MRTPYYTFDDTIKVGDHIVDLFNKKIGRVDNIVVKFLTEDLSLFVEEGGVETNPLVIYTPVANEKAQPLSISPKMEVDGYYIERLTDSFFESRCQDLKDEISAWERLKQSTIGGK